MTLKGCVLGNSHAACLREAWRTSGSERFSLEFVAAHAEKLDGLEIARGRAVARTDELRQTLKKLDMRRAFRLEEFDFFVLTGCQISIFRAVHATPTDSAWAAVLVTPDGGTEMVRTAAWVGRSAVYGGGGLRHVGRDDQRVGPYHDTQSLSHAQGHGLHVEVVVDPGGWFALPVTVAGQRQRAKLPLRGVVLGGVHGGGE